jgi:glucose/arabinose dehydrogenase
MVVCLPCLPHVFGMQRRLGIFFVLTLTIISSGCSTENVLSGVVLQSEEHAFRIVEEARGLNHPWGIAFLPDGSILITERPGDLVHVTKGRVLRVSGVPSVASVGQGGLLDITLAHDFESSGWIYFTYVKEEPTGSGSYTTALGRGHLIDNTLQNWQELFVMNNPSSSERHFGSRIVFDHDGHLYMTIGERGERNRAQDLSDHGGSTLRLDDNGEPAFGNPFSDHVDALPEIFSIGHRNAQGMTVHPDTGLIWLHEHGPRGGDEVNIIRAGNNYGWPEITYGREYSGGPVGDGSTHKQGMEQPLVHWEPSIAPSGMMFYTGSEFPGWQGDLFIGALAGKHLRRLVIEGETVVHEEVLLQDLVGRVRDVAQGPDGFIWLITDADNGRLYRLEPQ